MTDADGVKGKRGRDGVARLLICMDGRRMKTQATATRTGTRNWDRCRNVQTVRRRDGLWDDGGERSGIRAKAEPTRRGGARREGGRQREWGHRVNATGSVNVTVNATVSVSDSDSDGVSVSGRVSGGSGKGDGNAQWQWGQQHRYAAAATDVAKR